MIAELQDKEPSRKVAVEIANGLAAHGDAHLIAILLVNLLGNAWKYTAKQPEAQIAFGWVGPLRERDWLVQNRRKTQRVMLRFPVRVSGQNASGSQFEEETHTLAVWFLGDGLKSNLFRKLAIKPE